MGANKSCLLLSWIVIYPVDSTLHPLNNWDLASIDIGGTKSLLVPYQFMAEFWSPKAAMQNPIPIEPMHLFFHSHYCQQHMARGHARTTTTTMTTSDNMAPILYNLSMQLTMCMQFDIGEPFHSQMTAVKTGHLLTSIT